jgi:hypothetical protein
MFKPEFLHKYQPLLPCSHRPEFEHDLHRLELEDLSAEERLERERAQFRMESL